MKNDRDRWTDSKKVKDRQKQRQTLRDIDTETKKSETQREKTRTLILAETHIQCRQEQTKNIKKFF